MESQTVSKCNRFKAFVTVDIGHGVKIPVSFDCVFPFAWHLNYVYFIWRCRNLNPLAHFHAYPMCVRAEKKSKCYGFTQTQQTYHQTKHWRSLFRCCVFVTHRVCWHLKHFDYILWQISEILMISKATKGKAWIVAQHSHIMNGTHAIICTQAKI